MEITQERLDELYENYYEARLGKTELRMLIDVYRKAVNPYSEDAKCNAVRMTVKGFELMKGEDGFWLHFGNCALNAQTLFPKGRIGREQFGKWLDSQEPDLTTDDEINALERPDPANPNIVRRKSE